ncbi:MAG: DUF2244 domain-containing protein [Pseudomonadota bacterium]
MPYEWSAHTDADTGLSREALQLWPHRSMTNRGFATFIGVTFVLLCLPLIAVLGSPVLWALLPFLIGTLALTWVMIRMNDKALAMSEELVIWDDRIALTRHEARGTRRTWEAHPHWVRVALHEETGPVPNYVTLRGGEREVEIGAFLSADEREALFHDLAQRLGAGFSPPAQRP